LPTGGAVVLPLARLLVEADSLASFGGEIGVRLEPGERVEQIEPWLPRLGLVVLSFPSFADGRAFSTARILRERYAFPGEVRAVGDVQIDRYQFMRQCGFDAFEIRPERVRDRWARAEIEMSLTYQPDYAEVRGAEAVWQARRMRPALAAE
jgi:uncharacterized protein (DUF934 family)